MTKLNLLLFLIALACATAMVTSQHEARKLFTQLQRETDTAKKLDVEWGQLQLEQSTWAMHARIEKIATRHLGMHVPESGKVLVVQPLSREGSAPAKIASAGDDGARTTP